MCAPQIDRKQRFFRIRDIHFPHWERPEDPLSESILDGELVIDIDPKTGQVCHLTCPRSSPCTFYRLTIFSMFCASMRSTALS